MSSGTMDLIHINEFDLSYNPFLQTFLANVDLEKVISELNEAHRKIREQLPKGPIYSMRSEAKRLKSLLNLVPSSTWSPKELASAGFFRTGLEESCQCFYCGLVFCSQTLSVTPIEKHRKFNPHCAFIQGNDVGNISQYEIHPQCIEISPSENWNIMQNEQVRLQSYTHWPPYALLEPRVLAQAGLFFTGTRDIVQCFSCGGCLGNWEENDDPWKEHAKWFPKCEFLQGEKSKDEIKQYIENYNGFVGITGASFKNILNNETESALSTETGSILLSLKKHLVEKYHEPSFHHVSPFGDSVSVDLASHFADICVMLKDRKNQLVRQLTLPDILSELTDITMIEGETGSGKTALLKKIAILWASGSCPILSRFSLVFYISLASTESCQTLRDIICQQLIGSSTSLTEESLGEIIGELKGNALFLLDDYGLVDSIPGAIEELIQKNPWNRVNLLVTVNTDKGWKLRRYARTIMSIQKFPLYSSIYLAKKLFPHDIERVRNFFVKLETSKNLSAIYEIPLMILAQCSTWMKYPSDNTFRDINIFKEYLTYIIAKFPKETQLVNSQVSSCGELAIKGLFKSQFQFTENDLKAAGVDQDKAIKFGLLSKLTAQRLHSMYRFFSTSFQEFIAGKRLSELLESENREELDKGFHYLHQINTFLKIIGRYRYFLKYASRISTKATLKILSYLFSLYDKPEALDCHQDNTEHFQRHPELEIEEKAFILIVCKIINIDISYTCMNILMGFAIEAGEESQCLEDCAPIIMQFIAGKTMSFSVNRMNMNSSASILMFIEKYPHCISLFSCVNINLHNANLKHKALDFSGFANVCAPYGVPIVDEDYTSAYLSLRETIQDNKKNWMNQRLFMMSDHIEMHLSECEGFVKSIGSAIDQFSGAFKKLILHNTCLEVEELDMIFKMSSLQSLEIENVESTYTELLVHSIHKLTCLEEVSIVLPNNTQIVDNLPDDFETLKRMKKIVFQSSESDINSAKFDKFIQSFVDLEILHLNFKKLQDCNGLVTSLTTCKKLKELDLRGTRLQDSDMALIASAMKKFTRLKILNLAKQKIMAKDISETFAIALGSLFYLEKLWLPVGVGMAHSAKLIIEQFQNLPNLRFLAMLEILDDDSIALLADNKLVSQLHSSKLKLPHKETKRSRKVMQIKEVSAKEAKYGNLKNLQRLDLQVNSNITESGWTTFFEQAKDLPELKHLDISRMYTQQIKSHATTVTSFVKFVSRLPSLVNLLMYGWLLDEDDLNMFNAMKENHPQSKRRTINTTSHFTRLLERCESFFLVWYYLVPKDLEKMDLINISEFDSSHRSKGVPLSPHISHIDFNKAVCRLEESHRKIREQLPRQSNYSMRSEIKRLRSHWTQIPLLSWSPQEMAAAGFFRTGLENSIQCFCCGLVLCKHSLTYTPIEQHQKFNPCCEFIQGKDVGNILIYDVRVQLKKIIPIDVKESMDTEQIRLQSFTCWPVYALIKPCTLAESGFFFTGTRDIVQCFSCGGCLGNWEENDDPWREHTKWFPECKFLQKNKTSDERQQYIRSYCGFAEMTGTSFTHISEKILNLVTELTNGKTETQDKVNTLKKHLTEKYRDPTFCCASPFGNTVTIDLNSQFADISIMLKDIKNQPMWRLTLPDILSELTDITMIEGEAGSGKTALLKKIAILWASGSCPILSRFSLVFYISLASTESCQTLRDIICQQLIGSSTSLTEESLGEIIGELKGNALFLLDDYGLVDSIPGAIEELIQKNPWNRVNLAVTVNTDKGWKLRRYARTIMSIQKFPLYSSIYLAKNLFPPDSKQMDTFILELGTSLNFPSILQTPLMSLAQFSSWIQYPNDNTTGDVHVFKEYVKYNITKFPKEAEAVNSQVSSCGELALKGLFQSQFQFTENDLRAAGVDKEKAIRFGLLSKFTAQRLHSIYMFYDPSFQEFLAGKRLSELLESERKEDLNKGFHYLHQINTFLKFIGPYLYFMKYATRISTKATLKILSYLFSFYGNPEALDCDLDNTEHLQRHPELKEEEDHFLLILRKHKPVNIDLALSTVLLIFAINSAIESQCLPDCAPIILQFLTGKTFEFAVSLIINNSAEQILSFIEKYPESISLWSSIKFNIIAEKQQTLPDYSRLEIGWESYGVPTVERDYADAYLPLNDIKKENERIKNECDKVYSVFPSQIVIRDSIIQPFKSIREHKVPIFQIQVKEVNRENFSQVDCEDFKVLFSISARIELQLNDSTDFVRHLAPAIEQHLSSFKKLCICDSYLTAEEQDLILKMSSLESLEIGCNYSENYPEHLIRGIHNFPNLTEVTIYLLQNPEVLDHLPVEFERLDGMKKLAFGCTSFGIGSIKFVPFIRHFTDLEVLHLSLKYYIDFNGVMSSLSQCKKLKELSFFGSILHEDDMAVLAATMKNFTSLKTLNLDRHRIVGTETAEMFAVSLGPLSHLEKVWLPVGEGMAHAAKIIIEQFQHLPNLQFLSMKEILDDESIAALGKVSKNGFLKRICHLELPSNYSITESGWTKFFETAADMPELSNLNMIRICHESIKSQATTVTAFVRFVSRMPSLNAILMQGWQLDKDDLGMFNKMKEKHPQSKSLEIHWQIPIHFTPNIEN
ncbi:baculoviral IAP repeat-containing protein 1-like [Hyla sarda]|uniref:baculoviral IAP repeat-containing protein 1-like n=1 Tax=Hyla sarda TaxID=327740 RepID=UPI0024C34CC9|nr:baculoviral IAP repeat-containing protein 1-like [Hyla sarda]